MVPYQWPVALAVIWHIYSCLACSLEESAEGLPSSGKVVLGLGQVPCEFQADWPRFRFQGNSSQGAEQPSSPRFMRVVHNQQLQTWFGTFTCTCAAPRRMVIGTCHLRGRQPLPWRRSPVSFGQIGLGSVFQGKSWDKGPSSLTLPRMVHHPWPVAPDVIWHIYLHLYCSSRDGGRDLLSSGEAVISWTRWRIKKDLIIYVWFLEILDSIYLRATLVWIFAMLPTGVKNWLFFNSVDILFYESFQFCQSAPNFVDTLHVVYW